MGPFRGFRVLGFGEFKNSFLVLSDWLFFGFGFDCEDEREEAAVSGRD